MNMEKKRKSRSETTNHKQTKSRKTFTGGDRKSKKALTGKNGGDRRKRTGPHLPNSLRKDIEKLNPREPISDDEEIDSDEANDVYEYEEEVPEEESGKNRRYDRVENFEYKLPDEFKDENVPSDDDEEDDMEDALHGTEADEDDAGEDDGRHVRMLQGVTGMPSEVFQGKKKKNNAVISEAYPESEYNPTRDVLDGHGQISLEDLLNPLHGTAGYSKLRKRMHNIESKSTVLHAPLPKADQDRVERKAAYELSKKEVTKWEPLVKKNREASTIFFDEDVDLGFSTVGAIASEFEPRTEFEKKMASLVHDEAVTEAYRKDGSRLLEMNKISVEDETDRHNRLAKMRSLLFRHELKSKHIKKIKSKTYHRLLKKDKTKAAYAEMEMDPEAAKEQAMKQEFKRAEERMTLKHKNSNKWAKRILQRGLSTQDEGTRAAISEQLHQHALLTRKMNSMKDGSSSSDSSDDSSDDDGNLSGSDQDMASKLLTKAKEKTLKVLEEDDEVPNSGVLSLPFMVRGLKKRKEAANEEAKLALEEYESSIKQLEDTSGDEKLQPGNSGGRRVFGAAANKQQPESNKVKSSNKNIDRYYGSDDEDFAPEEHNDDGNDRSNEIQKDIHIDSNLFNDDSDTPQDSVLKSFDDIVKDPGPKTTYDVAIFASDKWKKNKIGKEPGTKIEKKRKVAAPVSHNQDPEEVGDDDSGDDSEGQMVDGILTSGPQPSYKLPSQAELISQAFAGDDVEEDFEKYKRDVLNEENPEPEKPVLLPGWGQWTKVQKKKGVPSWMLQEHENANKKREEALKKRKDAHLKHVIISEKVDRKAEKLHTKTLPFPFQSKEVFEQSIRMPIGPEFNPATAVGALNRPEVVKRSGVIIKPIKFEEVNPHEQAESKQNGQKQKANNKTQSGKSKNMKNKKRKLSNKS